MHPIRMHPIRPARRTCCTIPLSSDGDFPPKRGTTGLQDGGVRTAALHYALHFAHRRTVQLEHVPPDQPFCSDRRLHPPVRRNPALVPLVPLVPLVISLRRQNRTVLLEQLLNRSQSVSRDSGVASQMEGRQGIVGDKGISEHEQPSRPELVAAQI
eukprot:CAMPEP_0181234774 /NCGR_PEP_ID=MMETSP1096-20121128/37169_1 /TAXON_ID=156174 ORGANISM="Chrysochromulina ericina, Strain CCMP281" /NCGR_SAMPLE_ID=MMETSP1096 /ASSEMBLY_ACC=CAM_ASM_000453 /LENGTH=155 /DNA_ID=CAMNT_0023329605 /DNA_START=280 /DNA_END=747 /DNA_ORIENTATION=+